MPKMRYRLCVYAKGHLRQLLDAGAPLIPSLDPYHIYEDQRLVDWLLDNCPRQFEVSGPDRLTGRQGDAERRDHFLIFEHDPSDSMDHFMYLEDFMRRELKRLQAV